ncbi:hypothetical protein BH11PAT1_BH11PAT1_6260 [soil metagenome]
MGDSTAAGQGVAYTQGIAVGTAMHLAKQYTVTMTNLAVTGARMEDVLQKQVPFAKEKKPDLILIAVGANDVTHGTSLAALREKLTRSISELTKNNCNSKIVLTGSPDMGSVKLFAQPLRFVAGLQGNRVNKEIQKIIDEYQLTHAPIAKETGSFFRKDKTLFASDNFHPNERGYGLWIPVLNTAIDTALTSQPSHCQY